MTAFFNSLLSVTAGVSILIVLVVALSALLGKRYSRKWRYWAWLFIAIRLVVPFDLPFDTSIFTFSVPEESTYVTYVTEQNKTGAVVNNDKIVIEPSDVENVTQTPTDPTPIIPPTTITPPENDHIVIPNIPIEDVVDVAPVKTIPYTTIFMVVWIVGIAVSTIVYAVSHIRFLGCVKLWNRTVTEPWANEIFKNVKLEMGISDDVQLYRNRSVHSPILVGFFKPMILIPTRNLTENDLYMVLRHELLHYKRHDLWYKLLLVVAGCLHWFNPFVWFMVKRADRDLEIACDEAVVKGTSMEFRRDYCDTILRIIRCDRGRKPALSTGFTTGKKTMKKRFACALDFTKKRTGVVLLSLVLCAAILCSTFIACEVTKKDLTKFYDDVLYFAERIPQTFANASDLSNDFISGYLFNTITSKNEYKEDETGAVYIRQSEINEIAKLLLGMQTFVPDRELWMYHAESDSYAFYPAGEGPMYSGEITSSEEKNGTLYFTVKLTQKLYGSEDEEGYVPPKVYVITYAFTENDNDLYPLKSVKAEYDNTQEQTVFINANTLTEHLVWCVYEENYSADIPLVRTTFSDEEINRFLLHAASYIDKTEYRYSYIAEKSDDNRYPYFYSDFNIATSISEVFSLVFDWDLDTPVQEVTAAGYLVENAFGVTVQYNAQNMHSTASGNEIKTVFNLMAYTSDEEGPFYKDVGKYEAVYTINGEGLRFRYIQPYKETTSEVDVKRIGVLGYVDNAGTLPKHSATLSEKISDVNSFMFKKLRVCAFDAEKNGYVVHYYDYTEGDDALSLALAVETIVKGSGLKVNTARVEKSFVVVDLVPTGEAADNTKVKELLESIACTNDTNGYYLTGFTLSGGKFDFGGITLENDGYGKYEFEPLFNQPITTAELSAMRNLLEYPFADGIPIYDGIGTGVAFADSVTDKNVELASLIYYTAECGEYSDFSKLSNKYTAAMGIFMVPDTYDCMMAPEKWSEIVIDPYDYTHLKPLMTVISDFEFVTKEWVELAVKQIWGEESEFIHPSSTLGKWTYHALEGVYTPFHGGEGSDVLPYIHSVTKTADGYVAEVSYVTVNIEGAHGRDTNETIVTYDLFDNNEVIELAKRQNKYLVSAKYGDNGKLYLVSCRSNNYVEVSENPNFTVVSDATRYSYLDTVKVTVTNKSAEETDMSSSYCLLKKGENGWVEVKYERANPNFISAPSTFEGGESKVYSLSLLDVFENLEDGWYCFAFGPSGNGRAKSAQIVSNEFHITGTYVQDSVVVAENREGINPTAVAITYDYDSRMYIANLYGHREKEEFTFSHDFLLPYDLKGTLSLDGNIATITTDYCGVVMVVDFDKKTFEISYNFTASDMENLLATSSTGRYTLYSAGFTGAGDAGYSNVVLYDKNDKSYTYICYGGGMYGGGFEAGFLRNDDIYCTSLGELKIYNPETRQLKLDVEKNFPLGFSEEEQMHRELLTFRRDPNDFSFIVVYFEVENGYETKEVTDSLGTREELPATYKIGYLDKDGNLLESYDTGVGVWLGRYFLPLETSMRYSADTLTLIVGNEAQGFTGTFDTTTHEFKIK